MVVDVTLDPELCMGSGDCVRIAPSAFHLDDDAGVSRPTPGAATTELDVLREAARSCPTQAISLARDGIVLHASSAGGRPGSVPR